MDKYQDTKSFQQWMRQFIESDTPYGDLIRDMSNDSELPQSNKLIDFEWHLSKNNACDDAVSTLQSTFSDYEHYVKISNHLQGNDISKN